MQFLVIAIDDRKRTHEARFIAAPHIWRVILRGRRSSFDLHGFRSWTQVDLDCVLATRSAGDDQILSDGLTASKPLDLDPISAGRDRNTEGPIPADGNTLGCVGVHVRQNDYDFSPVWQR